MIKKIVAFIALAVYMQTALYAQENQNRTLINAALHGWEYEIRAGVSIGGTSPLPLPVEIRSIDAYNPTLALMLEGNAIKWLGKTKKWGVITGGSYSKISSTSSTKRVLPGAPSKVAPFLLDAKMILSLYFPFASLVSSISFPYL